MTQSTNYSAGLIKSAGGYCQVTIENGLATKTTTGGFDTEPRAAFAAETLIQYAAALAAEPLPTARVHDVQVLPADEYGLFQIRHTMDAVPGSFLWELPAEQQQTALQQLVGNLSHMAQLPSRPHHLAIPVDCNEPNFRLDANGTVTLLDLYKPLLRDQAGAIAIHAIFPDMEPHSRTQEETKFGYLPRVISTLLIDLGHRARIRADALQDWCLAALPRDGQLDPELRELIHEALVSRLRRKL